MPRLSCALCLSLAALAAPAAAQQAAFRGAELSATGAYVDAGPIGLGLGQLSGSAELALSDATFFQLDASAYRFQLLGLGGAGFGVTGGEIGGHLGVAAGPDTALGLFGSVAGFGLGFAQVSLGAEAVTRLGPIGLEAYAGTTRNTLLPLEQYHAGATLSYDLGAAWQIRAGGGLYADNIGLRGYRATAGLGYTLADGLELAADYSYTRVTPFGANVHTVGLSLTKVFGGGTTFGRRDQPSLLRGF